jgi:hypothetical protein
MQARRPTTGQRNAIAAALANRTQGEERGIGRLEGRPWLGNSWALCPLRILALTGPVFLGLLWSLRQLAPTDLRSAGAAAGLASGALGALLYCFRCPESSALFVVTWYTLGILAAGALGALAGPRLLRW